MPMVRVSAIDLADLLGNVPPVSNTHQNRWLHQALELDPEARGKGMLAEATIEPAVIIQEDRRTLTDGVGKPCANKRAVAAEARPGHCEDTPRRGGERRRDLLCRIAKFMLPGEPS